MNYSKCLFWEKSLKFKFKSYSSAETPFGLARGLKGRSNLPVEDLGTYELIGFSDIKHISLKLKIKKHIYLSLKLRH